MRVAPCFCRILHAAWVEHRAFALRGQGLILATDEGIKKRSRCLPALLLTMRVPYRSCGGMSLIRAQCAAMSSTGYFRCTRLSDGTCLTVQTPGRHSREGRTGRGENPPPQFGQTLESLVSTQSAQKVHSYEQIRASSAVGGRSLSQYSQFGRSCSAMADHPVGAPIMASRRARKMADFPRFAPCAIAPSIRWPRQ